MIYTSLPASANPPATHIDVWCWRLDRPELSSSSACTLLSEDERQRAARFVFDVHRTRYIAAHVRLRLLLGDYLGCDPAALRFSTNRFGKPCLADGPEAEHGLTFNLSHTEDIAVLGVAEDLPLGIDVEALRPAPLEIADHFFSHAEREELAKLERDARDIGFFQCWTRKEAFIKALGSGLSTPLDSFSVSLSPGIPACLRMVDGDPQEAARWQLVHLDPAPGHVGAIAARSRGWCAILRERP